jgi:hypothetical protein
LPSFEYVRLNPEDLGFRTNQTGMDEEEESPAGRVHIGPSPITGYFDFTSLHDVMPASIVKSGSRLILIRLEQHERFSEKNVRAPVQDRTDLETAQKP